MPSDKQQAYQVLARKYRPQNFDDLIGQDVLVQTLTNAFKHDRIAHAFLLTGIRGIGKTTTARIIALALNCTGKDGKGGPTISPCGKCENCIAIKEGRHVDVIEMDAASRTGVDDVREIIDNANYLPTNARFKIYIIDEVHMLSKNAFNALLKTLEEPPEHVKFIFATTEIRKIPITILSRCQRFDLRRIEHKTLTQHLENICKKEKAKAETEALQLISSASEGSVRDALSLLDQAIAITDGKITAESVSNMMGLSDANLLIDLFEHIAKGDIKAAIQSFKQLYDAGADPLLIMHDLLDFNYLVTKTKVVPETKNDQSIPEHKRNKASEFAEQLSIPYLSRSWNMLLKGYAEVHSAQNAFIAAEMLLVRLTHMSDLPTPDVIIRQLQENTPSNPTPPAATAPATATSAASAPIAAPSAEPQRITEEETISMLNFKQLVEIFKVKGEIYLHGVLYSDIHPVSFKPGHLEIRQGDTVPQNFAARISECLQSWTGQRWVISISSQAGDSTLEEQAKSQHKSGMDELKKRPEVAKILDFFPGATICKVTDKT